MKMIDQARAAIGEPKLAAPMKPVSSHIFLLNARCIQISQFMLMNTFFIPAIF